MPQLQSFESMGINLNKIYTDDSGTQYPYIVTWYDRDLDTWVKQVFDLANDSRLFANILARRKLPLDVLVWNSESRSYGRVDIHAWVYHCTRKPYKHTMQ